MDKLFQSLKGLVKSQGTKIDDIVFRLHYRATSMLLLAFGLMVSSYQYIGDPISCFSRDKIPAKLMDTYCWVHTTFSVDDAWSKEVGVEVPYPGVDSYKPGEKRIYHAYYQWVGFVLFLQAFLFYLPHHIWKAFEGRRISDLVLELDNPVLEVKKRKSNRGLLVSYFVSHLNHHNPFFVCYFVCEVMNTVNVVGQMFLMDAFLGGEFSSYGLKVVQFTGWDYSLRYDPMIRVFPRLTKCTFHHFGPSGDVQKHDAMCVLPINIANEKIFVFLWFWFVVLAVLSCLVLVYRLIVVFSPAARYLSLRPTYGVATKNSRLYGVLTKLGVADWFVLQLLAKNLDSRNFRDFAYDLGKRLDEGGGPLRKV